MPMRVAHFITRLILGGAQENTVLTVEGQSANPDLDVALVTGPAVGPEGDLMGRATAGDYHLEIVEEMQREIQPQRDGTTYKRLLEFCRRWQPDVVHTHSSKAGVVGRAAARKAGVPLVIHTIHGLPFHPYESLWKNYVFIHAERWAARRTDHIISVCNAMTDQAVKAGIAPRDKFTTVYSGMEVSHYQQPAVPREAMRQQLGLNDDDVVVGKVARLFELKGHEDLLEIAPEVIETQPHVKFLWVGDGNLRSQLENRVRELGLRDRFIFTGLVPSEEVPNYLHAMDIVVHCSLREGLARVLPQALIAGKPVVSYNIDGSREVVIHGETGFLIEPQNLRRLTEYIVRLSRSADLRQRLGDTGRSRFTDQFRHTKMVRDINHVYRRAAESKGVAWHVGDDGAGLGKGGE